MLICSPAWAAGIAPRGFARIAHFLNPTSTFRAQARLLRDPVAHAVYCSFQFARTCVARGLPRMRVYACLTFSLSGQRRLSFCWKSPPGPSRESRWFFCWVLWLAVSSGQGEEKRSSRYVREVPISTWEMVIARDSIGATSRRWKTCSSTFHVFGSFVCVLFFLCLERAFRSRRHTLQTEVMHCGRNSQRACYFCSNAQDVPV